MSKKEKLQSKKMTVKTPAVNIFVKKSLVEVSTPKKKYTKARISTKKVSTVKSDTTVILHEKTK